jgi:hypothetical protein
MIIKIIMSNQNNKDISPLNPKEIIIKDKTSMMLYIIKRVH